MLRCGLLPRTARSLKICVLAFSLLFASCLHSPTRTVYVRPTQPVRLRETLKDVKIWVLDGEGKWQESTLDLQEGWFVVDDPGKQPVK